MVGAGSLMGKPYCFWKQSAQQNHRYGEKCAPETSFSGVSRTVWVFLRKKNLKTVFGTQFTKKKVIFIFVVRPTVPSKMVTSPKNNFSLIFWKILFFSKKLLAKKIFKTSMPTKKVILIFVARCPPSLKRAIPFHK